MPFYNNHTADGRRQNRPPKEKQMERPNLYRKRTFKELFEGYKRSGENLEPRPAEINRGYIMNELYSRINDTLTAIDNGDDLNAAFNLLINGAEYFYRLVDDYCCQNQLICETYNYYEVARKAQQRIKDTSGRCELYVIDEYGKEKMYHEGKY